MWTLTVMFCQACAGVALLCNVQNAHISCRHVGNEAEKQLEHPAGVLPTKQGPGIGKRDCDLSVVHSYAAVPVDLAQLTF